MKRIAVLALIIGTLFIATPAHADEPTCTVQPLVAGECVTQPVADYVMLQLDIIASQQQQLTAFSDALRAERAAHEETFLLLTSANAQVSELNEAIYMLRVKVTRKNATIQRLRAQIRDLESQ